MKRALVVASVASMIDQFNIPNIKLLKQLGYKVDVACNFIEGSSCSAEKISKLRELLVSLDVEFFQVDFSRSIFDVEKNISAFNQISKLLKNNYYDLVHCHSPIGGLITRIATNEYRKTGTKVIYTAHGFHFYKGAPLINWLLYYPIEKMCSYRTDTLITINKEDFDFAKRKMKAKSIVYVPGVGIDIDKFKNCNVDRNSKLKELDIPEDSFIVFSVGELNKNKNHEAVIRAIGNLHNDKIHYLIAGKGELHDYLVTVAKQEHVNLHLLGFRTDVPELYKLADLYIHPSFREGLPVSVMEALASGCKVIGSDIRGNRDLLEKNVWFYPTDVEHISFFISDFVKGKGCFSLKESNVDLFSCAFVEKKMKNIYEDN